MRRFFGLFALLCVCLIPSCATVKTDAKADWQAIVACAKSDAANPDLKLAVANCIGAVASGNEQQCLIEAGVFNSWTLDEVACVGKLTGGK